MDAKPLAWNELQTFLAAAQGGTLSSAAKTLDTSAATVLRTLRALEKRLNSSLFSRSTHGYKLTPAGHELLEHVLAIESEALAAERRVSGRDQRLAGTIRVATADDLAYRLLGRLFADFTVRHPGVCLELIVESEYTNLARRSADVAIRPGARPSAEDVIPRRVCDIGIGLYASRAYLRRYGTPASLEALKGHRIVRAGQGASQTLIEKMIERHVEPSASVFRSNSMLARAVALRDGIGIGLLPCFVGDTDPGLVRVGPLMPQAAALWILIHRDLRSNALVRRFVDYAQEQLLRSKKSLAGEAQTRAT